MSMILTRMFSLKACRRLALAVMITGGMTTIYAGAPGEVLPPWTPGTLDIHHINNGQGDSALLIFPDGTTLLIDVGDTRGTVRPPLYIAPPKPDGTRPPGEWVARYVQRWHPDGDKGALDYVLLTHFDGDHMAGFGDLVKHVRIRRVIDRAWPEYGPPRPLLDRMRPAVMRYRAEIDRLRETDGLIVERFEAGRNDQIVQQRQPDGSTAFEIQNLAVNGEVWTGRGLETVSRFPAEDPPAENPCSTVLRLRYGRFTYYNGGDLVGQLREDEPAWRDVESALAWHVGPVDVHVADHHGTRDSSNAFFLSVLQPRVHIVQVWSPTHPYPDVLERMRSEKIYPGPRDVFATNGLWEGRRGHLDKLFGEEAAAQFAAELAQLAGVQGHIVVRVEPGGGSYRVFMLDDTAESARILSVHGPYQSR